MRAAHRELGRSRRAQTIRTGDLVHEAYLKLARAPEPEWERRAHFLAIAARAMRQVVIDYARRGAALKRGGDPVRTTLTGRHLAFEVDLDELFDLDRALDRLGTVSDRLRQVVEYRFFGGLEKSEIADLLGISVRTVERDWTRARLFLVREIRPDTGVRAAEPPTDPPGPTRE